MKRRFEICDGDVGTEAYRDEYVAQLRAALCETVAIVQDHWEQMEGLATSPWCEARLAEWSALTDREVTRPRDPAKGE